MAASSTKPCRHDHRRGGRGKKAPWRSGLPTAKGHRDGLALLFSHPRYVRRAVTVCARRPRPLDARLHPPNFRWKLPQREDPVIHQLTCGDGARQRRRGFRLRPSSPKDSVGDIGIRGTLTCKPDHDPLRIKIGKRRILPSVFFLMVPDSRRADAHRNRGLPRQILIRRGFSYAVSINVPILTKKI